MADQDIRDAAKALAHWFESQRIQRLGDAGNVLVHVLAFFTVNTLEDEARQEKFLDDILNECLNDYVTKHRKAKRAKRRAR